MEQSAFEAIIIGVNVFVFIVALTSGILLMSNILDMVNFANDQAIVGMNGTLAESVGEVTERTYTGAQLLKYYEKTLDGDKSSYIFRVKLDKLGQEYAIASFIKNISQYLNEKFELEYRGLEGEKYTYVFSLVNEQENKL